MIPYPVSCTICKSVPRLLSCFTISGLKGDVLNSSELTTLRGSTLASDRKAAYAVSLVQTYGQFSPVGPCQQAATIKKARKCRTSFEDRAHMKRLATVECSILYAIHGALSEIIHSHRVQSIEKKCATRDLSTAQAWECTHKH